MLGGLVGVALKLNRKASLGEAPGRYLETGGVWSVPQSGGEGLARPQTVEVGRGTSYWEGKFNFKLRTLNVADVGLPAGSRKKLAG